MNNYWLQRINQRKLQAHLENNFLGERYAEVSFDVVHEAAASRYFHRDFSINLIVDDSDKIMEIQVWH